MELLVQIMAILSPIVILLTTFIIVRAFLRREGDAVKGLLYREADARRFELQYKNRELTMPVRLQAYERMTLFCARIDLGQLIMRLRQPNMKVKDMRILLVMSIEEEFSHNIAQQMYMSEDLWNIIVMAKMEAIAIVKQVAAQSDDSEDAQVFIDNFIRRCETAPQMGNLQAQVGIKKEVSMLF